MPPDRPPRHAAACYWSPFLAIALFEGEQVIGVTASSVRAGRRHRAQLDAILTRFVTTYWPEAFVVEERLAKRLGLRLKDGQVQSMTVATAKRILLP